MQLAPEPFRGRDVGCGTSAKEAANVSKNPKFERCEPSLPRIAPETFRLMAGHEVAGARHAGGLDQKLPIGANGLKSVVFDDEGLARCKAKEEGCQRRAGDVNNIGIPNQSPELNEARLPNRTEWKRSIVVISRRSFGDEGDFELRCSV